MPRRSSLTTDISCLGNCLFGAFVQFSSHFPLFLLLLTCTGSLTLLDIRLDCATTFFWSVIQSIPLFMVSFLDSEYFVFCVVSFTALLTYSLFWGSYLKHPSLLPGCKFRFLYSFLSHAWSLPTWSLLLHLVRGKALYFSRLWTSFPKTHPLSPLWPQLLPIKSHVCGSVPGLSPVLLSPSSTPTPPPSCYTVGANILELVQKSGFQIFQDTSLIWWCWACVSRTSHQPKQQRTPF